MDMKRFSILLYLWVGFTIAVFATDGIWSLSINKESGIYEKGELAVVSCHSDVAPADSLIVKPIISVVCTYVSCVPLSI